jgi:hypothetical protein
MFTTSGFRNLGEEGCFGRRVAEYRFKVKGHVTVLVLDPSYCHNSPLGKLLVTCPKIIDYCRLGVAELKLEPSPEPFGLAS